MFEYTFTNRAWVGRKHIMPITSKPEVKKRSQRWVQANEEMKEYQRQLALLYPDAKQKVNKNNDHTSLRSISVSEQLYVPSPNPTVTLTY